MTGKNKLEKEMEKQSETLEEILLRLTSMETQISDIKHKNKELCSQMSELRKDNQLLKDTLSEIKSDNDKLSKKVVQLENKTDDHEKNNVIINKRVTNIEDIIDQHEQYSKLDNLVVTGLQILRPYNATANGNNTEVDDDGNEQWSARDKDIMIDNFAKFAKDKLQVDINYHDITDIHTLPKGRNKSETCIIRFSNRIVREKIIKNRKKLATKSRNAHKIYINEHLTKRNAAIAREARIMRTDGKIQGTWTNNCRIFVKLHDDKVIKIHTMKDLHNL